MFSVDSCRAAGSKSIKGWKCAWLSLLICLTLILLPLLSACGADTSSDTDQTSGLGESALEEPSHYTITLRNATEQSRLPGAVRMLLERNGFSYGEGYVFDSDTAYEQNQTTPLANSFIVFEEGREDLEERAEIIRAILGIGTVTSGGSGETSWSYDGDILMVLGADCLGTGGDFDHRAFINASRLWEQQRLSLISVRNAAGEHSLADAAMILLYEAGFTLEDGFIFDVGDAYAGPSLLEQEESHIIIKEGREDLRAHAALMQEVLGISTITEEDSSAANWVYDGDILIVLGTSYRG